MKAQIAAASAVSALVAATLGLSAGPAAAGTRARTGIERPWSAAVSGNVSPRTRTAVPARSVPQNPVPVPWVLEAPVPVPWVLH